MKTVSALVLAMCAFAHADGEEAIDSILSETQRLLSGDGGSVPCWKSHVCSHGTCFHGSDMVVLEDGSQKTMESLQIGDRIQSADFNGTVSISPVVFLPHKSNDELTTFLEVTTESGKSVHMTPDHLIPNCGGDIIVARSLMVDDCIFTVDGHEAIKSITSSQMTGIYTAVTENKFVVVNGIVASPFSQDRKIERQHQTRERQRLLQSERKLLRGQN